MKVEIENTLYFDFRNTGENIDILPVLKYALHHTKLKWRKYYAVEVLFRLNKNNRIKRFMVHKNKLFSFQISRWPDIIKFPESKKKVAENILKKFNQKNLDRGIRAFNKGVDDLTKTIDEFGKAASGFDKEIKKDKKDYSFLIGSGKKKDDRDYDFLTKRNPKPKFFDW